LSYTTTEKRGVQMNCVWLTTLTLAGEKREEKARKPAKNDGWLGNLQKTWYNRTASNFHNRLLLRYDMV